MSMAISFTVIPDYNWDYVVITCISGHNCMFAGFIAMVFLVEFHISVDP
jgi:hypothetical protein